MELLFVVFCGLVTLSTSFLTLRRTSLTAFGGEVVLEAKAVSSHVLMVLVVWALHVQHLLELRWVHALQAGLHSSYNLGFGLPILPGSLPRHVSLSIQVANPVART